MPVSLDQILAATRRRVAAAQRSAQMRQLEAEAEQHVPRGFQAALEKAGERGPAVIAELKKASPSRGLIRGSLHVGYLAIRLASAGAAALSVLTEEEFFQGSLDNLREASAATEIPVLRKDFIIDEWQILEARAHRADAVLLIAAALDQKQLVALQRCSRELNLDVLCEVHDQPELARALDAGFTMIGVNSRDLRSFEVDLGTALRLGPLIPPGVVRVAESGIQCGADIARLRATGYQAFLIGEALMKVPDPGQELKRFLVENSVSGARAN